MARATPRPASIRDIAQRARLTLRAAVLRAAPVPLPLASRLGNALARRGGDRRGRDPADRLALRGGQEGDGPFFGRRAVAGAELLLEHTPELAARRQLLGDVGAADQLALHEDLRNRRPARERGELLADGWIGKDVDRGHGRSGLTQRAQCAVGVAAHDELRRPLHEERHGLVLDQILDALAQLGHSLPFVLIRSSWIVPSRSGSASASFTSRCCSSSERLTNLGLATTTWKWSPPPVRSSTVSSVASGNARSSSTCRESTATKPC